MYDDSREFVDSLIEDFEEEHSIICKILELDQMNYTYYF